MLYLSRPERVYLYCSIVDFRKQMNGLAAVVEAEFAPGELASSWFVFISRDRRKVKILYWRGSGLALWQYRLEEESFQLGRPRCLVTKSIRWSDLKKFLDGYNIFAGERHESLTVKRYS